MIKIQGIDELIEKIENLRSSLRVSDEILPLISDLFLFIKDIIPLMLDTHSFMRDSTNKIPSASENLNRVTQTTEMATHEVMDRLETIIHKLDLLKTNVTNDIHKENSLRMIDEIQNDASDIFLAFQFQDITSQQLEYVQRILGAIYEKFLHLFNTSLKIRANTILGKEMVEAIEKELGQDVLDKQSEEFSRKTSDLVRQEGISQDLIDKYFKPGE